MKTEIEIKIKISDEQKQIILDWLNNNAAYSNEYSHTEYYLDNPKSSFTFESYEGYKDSKDFLRVRFTKNGDSVCFKHWHYDQQTSKMTHCDEFETKIEKGKELLDIFNRIGFTEHIIIKKNRKSYVTNDYEISLDSVDGLGEFVEIELLHNNSSVEEGISSIYKFLSSIGVKRFYVMDRGYVSMMWNPLYDFGTEVSLE